ncbi:hypothetical protein IGI04_002835 [Brassica rapa subsp. trilocularis]|uniref:Uncharacterized protein n=1 Tax=Brassica rapa subsp. trilocularis TaxID=1813537 RepID=A0ABQ7NWN4_BRACM|nr:hypothetical protein IGI04_002835 [Brassica rapa subsp. trilocularis]
MMNQSYPPNKSVCNSPHPSSYSMISMPLEDLLINHLNETHLISLLSLLKLYIYPNPTISSSANASQNYGKSNDSCHRSGDSKLMFRLIHFWEACNNSKGSILIGTKMVISQKDMIAYHEHAGKASNSHPPMIDAVSNEFWEQKIVRKSNGADIYKLQRNNRPVEKILETYTQFFIGFVMEKKIRSGYRSCRRYVLSIRTMIGDETYSSSNGSFFENIKYENFKLRVFLFVLSSTDIFNFGLFILEMITNLKPGEEQEDPERRERVVDENMKIEERTLGKIKQVITLGLMFTDKSPSKQIKLLRRFMTCCFFV